MKKLKCTIYAPITEYSFYGRKSRQFIKNIIKTRPDFDVRIVEYRTKNIKQGYIDKELLTYIGAAWEDTDICFFFSNPSLYDTVGKIANIAFVDTSDIINANDLKLFVDKCNIMSLVFVCTNYAKNTLKELTYKEGDEVINIHTDVVVTTEYAPINELNINSAESILDSVSTDKNFLLEGRWDTEDDVVFGGKNKDNISYVISNFLETFKDIEDAPGLVVHVHGPLASTVDMYKLNNKINDIRNSIEYIQYLPKIYLLNGELTDEQTWSLYNDPKILSLIRVPQRCDSIESELNFMSACKPIIYSNFGSQTEALRYKSNIPVNCQIKELTMEGIGGHGPKLADIFGADLKLALYEVYYHYETMRSFAYKTAASFFMNNDSRRMFGIFDSVLNQIIPLQSDAASPDEIATIPDSTPKTTRRKVTVKKKPEES